MSLLSVAGISFVVGLCFMTFGKFLFQKLGWVDNPGKYGFERKAVAYSMGVWSVLAFVVLVLLFLDFSLKIGLLLIAVLMLGLVCFADDRYGLHPLIRLLVQVCAAGIVVYSGSEIFSVTNPFNFKVIELGVWGFIFSVFWIVALTNLMNFLDGVSALSSGVSSIGFLIIFGLSILPGMHQTDQSLVQVLALILFVLSFLNFIFEFPTPKFLIGDSGTMFFGFMLGVLSMINGGKLATAALVLLVPLFDGIWVITRRVLDKKSPFRGDMGHLHHRLERVGFSKESILFIYMVISLLFGLVAILVWNTLFKIISLILLLTALSVTGYLVWTKETK